ncbi:uncharacterized protein LOC143358243 isoform X2 [Halictus rubicundus]
MRAEIERTQDLNVLDPLLQTTPRIPYRCAIYISYLLTTTLKLARLQTEVRTLSVALIPENTGGIARGMLIPFWKDFKRIWQSLISGIANPPTLGCRL